MEFIYKIWNVSITNAVKKCKSPFDCNTGWPLDFIIGANTMNPDQIAPKGAV